MKFNGRGRFRYTWNIFTHLRVDYLRAGQGQSITATGTVLRRGNTVSVVGTELMNNQQLLIAPGIGTYLGGESDRLLGDYVFSKRSGRNYRRHVFLEWQLRITSFFIASFA